MYDNTIFKSDGTRSYESCIVENGEFEMEFSDLLRCSDTFELSDLSSYLGKEPVRPAKNQTKLMDENSKTVDYKTAFSYAGALDDVCKAFLNTEHWYKRSTAEYINLRNATKKIRNDLVSMSGKPVKDFKEKLESLSKQINAYEEYCAKHPVKPNNSRRNARVKATNDLKQSIEAIKKLYRNPRDYKKDLTAQENTINTEPSRVNNAPVKKYI